MAKMRDIDDEFEDNPNPGRSRDGYEDIAFAKSKVATPATVLLVVGFISMLISIGNFAVSILMPALIVNMSFDLSKSIINGLPPGPEKDKAVTKLEADRQNALAQGVNPINVGIGFASLVAQAITLLGLIKMRQAKSYGLSLTACILSMIVYVWCCCFPLIFSILGVVALVNPRVKSGFEANRA
jgi:hypothetical protein